MTETIYQTVPNLKEVKQESKDSLVGFLRSNPGRFYTASKLAVECGFPRTTTNPELRKAVTELIAEGKPIISNAKGFGWAVHQNQIEHYIEQLQFRMLGIQRRINDLRKLRI